MKPKARILITSLSLLLPTTLFAADLNGVVMKDGKVSIVENGKKTELTGDRTLQNGTKITNTGQVTTADGKTFQLKNGDMIAEDGSFRTHVVKDGVLKKDEGGETALKDGDIVKTDGTILVAANDDQ